MVYSVSSFSPAHGGRLKYKPSLEVGGLFLPNWQAQLGVTAWEAGTSCVQGGKGKGRELMVVSVTWGGVYPQEPVIQVQEHPGMCALIIQWKQKLGLHSRNKDKDVKRSGSLKRTMIFTGDQEPVEKPRKEG